MTASPEDRLAHLEAAFIALLDRTIVLERALAFEVEQREAMERVILGLTGLPCRVDRLELAGIAARKTQPIRSAG